MRWDPTRDQALIQSMGCAINAILKVERIWRKDASVEEVNQMLVTDLPPPMGRLAPDEGVVLGCGQLHSATRTLELPLSGSWRSG